MNRPNGHAKIKTTERFLNGLRPLGVVTSAFVGALTFAGLFYGSVVFSDGLGQRACAIANSHFTSPVSRAIVVPFTIGCELAHWLNEDPFEGAK